MGILIEHFAGAFPLWLAPEQVRVLPISREVRRLRPARSSASCRPPASASTVDYRPEKIGAKIRDAQLEKIPVHARRRRQGGREPDRLRTATASTATSAPCRWPQAVAQLKAETDARTIRQVAPPATATTPTATAAQQSIDGVRTLPGDAASGILTQGQGAVRGDRRREFPAGDRYRRRPPGRRAARARGSTGRPCSSRTLDERCGGTVVPEVRELPAGRRVQVPGGDERPAAAGRRGARGGRRHPLLGQPRPGPGAGGPTARRAGLRGDAPDRAGGEAGGDRGLRRPGRAVRADARRARGDRRRTDRARTA